MSDLLDRPIGSLTLRELAALAKAAQTMSAALEAEALPEKADIQIPTAPVRQVSAARPTVADGIRAVVGGRSPPKVAGPLNKRQPDQPDFDPGAEAKARALFMAGRTCQEIAEVIGRPVGTVYAWSCKAKWRKARLAAARVPAAKTNGARLTKEQEEARDSNPDLSDRWMS